jgi:hypothetical protein
VIEKIPFVNTAQETARMIADSLRNEEPIQDLPGVSIRNVREEPEEGFDVSFQLKSGGSRVQVLGEIKSTFSPRLLEEISPWVKRLKLLRPDIAIAVLTPMLSPQAQAFCIRNGIDFMDLAGNLYFNVPGKFTLQRSGKRLRSEWKLGTDSERTINVFSGRSSRVLRVLLEKPKSWGITEIARELRTETSRAIATLGSRVDFEISLGSVSKAITSLEEQLLIRRRGSSIFVPEPARLLGQWAEKYKERYRWRLRSSFQTGNPFGRELLNIEKSLEEVIKSGFVFTGAIAVSKEAPFVDIDVADIFLVSKDSDSKLRNLKSQPSVGPMLRFIYPYDVGVFMYSKEVGKARVVSNIQAYLDLYARGGRDLKQANYLLSNSIQPLWGAA